MRTNADHSILIPDTISRIQFNDIFDLDEIQHLQDLFSDATGVASIITHPDGTPITKPSNFCKLCNIIRNTEKGRANCFKSDTTIGKLNSSGPIVQPCLSGGLWDAGASITVGDKHIANWLIGQVRNNKIDEKKMIHYASEIGANRKDFINALNEVPVMSVEQINKVSKMLYEFANELSEKANNNLELINQIAETAETTKLLVQNKTKHLKIESKYSTIFENVEDVFYRIGMSGNILEISSSIKQFTEFNRDELIGTPSLNLYFNPRDRDLFLNELMNHGEVRDFEFMMKSKTGNIKYVLNNACFVYDLKGRPIHIDGTIRDITKRKKAEMALRSSEVMHRKMLANIGEVIVIIDKDGINRYKSPNVEKLFGWQPEELVGQSTWDNIHPLDLPESRKFMDTLGGTPNATGTIECRYRCKNGIYKWIEFSAINLLDDPDIQGFLGNYHDITERNATERQLKLLSRAIEQSPVTVMITNKQGRIEYANPKFTELTGYTADEVKGLNPRFLQSGKHNGEFYNNLWTTILSGKDWSGEFHNKKKNGDFYIEKATISSILNSHGEILFFIAVMEDITEKRKMLEDLIQTKERAEESDRLKTSFLNNISHEIRTPFNGILGFLAILEDNDLTPNEKAEYKDIINKSAYRLMNTINDIVEISQIQAGQIKLSVSETNISNLTNGVYEQFKKEAESKGLKLFTSNYLPKNIDCINTDNTKINSILAILVGNAIKFTKTGSVEIGIRMAGNINELRFFVKDTGVGIAENKQEAIFERFMQGDGSNTRQFEGSGLGLSIAKAYVEMLGGNIWVESKEGKGAEFCFTIPFIYTQKVKNEIENMQSLSRSERQINSKVSGLKILIAEDDERSAMFLEIAVRNYGKEILVVKNGVEAVEACRNNPEIDLILMDVKMPEMDGYEATAQIRQFNKDVVIIAQTAFAMSGDREMTINAGCNDYISKPIKKDKLRELVQKYFKI